MRRPSRLRIAAVVATAVLVLAALPRPARAFVFHDGPAFAQRALWIYQQFQRYRQMINAANDTLHTLQTAMKGGQNWRNLGWLDTLQILDSPWLDSVKGIDDIRAATTATVMTVEQATKLWSDVEGLGHWKNSGRYQRDGWFRSKIDSIGRQSVRARAQRAAVVRQMQAQNRELIEDLKKIKRLRDAIEEETTKSPVNHARITSLQAELAATEAKYQGENMMLVNQRAIMFLVGEDEAYRSYLEATQSDWLDRNNRGVLDFGRGFAR
jgi:hypothetical protein